MPKKRRNPNQFLPEEIRREIRIARLTTEQAQTAALLVAEGSATCYRRVVKGRHYQSPRLTIDMCDKEALTPASKVMHVTVKADRRRAVTCPFHLFPPDGKGSWRVENWGKHARKTITELEPLLTTEFKRKWKHMEETCK